MARRGGDIVEHLDAHAWIASLDQGHFPDAGLTLSADGACAVLAGQPLLAPAGRDRAALFSAMADGNRAALAHVRGQFAALQWSARDRTLRLCADALATRPVHVAIGWSGAVFATTMRTLRALATSVLRLDARALADLIHFRYLLGVRTIHEGVRLVGPAELLELRPDGQQSLLYLDWAQIESTAMDRDTAIDALHATFAEALALRQPGAPTEASLSGGMDSRSVVAGLVDAGHRPRTWCLAFPGSADHQLSRMAAEAMGLEYHWLENSPAGRMRAYFFALVPRLREHWARTGQYALDAPVRLWTGFGGGRALGNNRLDAPAVATGAQPPSQAQARTLFPAFGRRDTRLIDRARYLRLRALGFDNVAQEFARCGRAPPDRRLWMFYLLNKDVRHTHGLTQESDATGIELLLPIYDTALLRLIASLPIHWLTGHALYNDWIARFRAPAAAVAWQSYPGHVPSPAPMPASVRLQWDRQWYASKDVRQVVAQAAAFALDRADPRLADWIEPWRARLALASLRLGSQRREHDLALLRMAHRMLTGEDAFEEPPRDQWIAPRVRQALATPPEGAARPAAQPPAAIAA